MLDSGKLSILPQEWRLGAPRRWSGGHVMKCIALTATLAIAFPAALSAQTAEPVPPTHREPAQTGGEPGLLDRAKASALEHMRAGRYAEAVPHARIAVALSQKSFGADATEAAVATHSLAFLLRRKGEIDEARALFEKAIAIYERRLPAIHEDTRNAIGELGQIYMKDGRGAEVAALYTGLIARAGREGNGDHVAVAHMGTNLGFVLRGLGQAAQSETAFRQAVSIYEKNDALDGEPYRLALEAWLDRLESGGRFDQSIAASKASIQRLSARPATVSQLTIRLHNRVSGLALEAGQFADAKSHAQAALRLAESIAAAGAGEAPAAGRPGADQIISALNNLARAHRAVADYSSAELAYKRAISLLDGRGDKANSGILTDNLAVLYLHQGRFDEAERHHKRALALLEEALGREHASVGRAAANLGTMLNEAGRPIEAEPLLRRALAIANARSPNDAVGIGVIEDNLAGLLRRTGRHAEAREHLQRALALFEGALPPRHPRLATARNNIGRFLLDIGDLDQAEAQLKRALETSAAIYGRDSAHNAFAASNLAEVYTATRRYSEGRALFQKALAALEAAHGPNHYNALVTLNAAGRLELADGKPLAALSLFERAFLIELATRARRGLRSDGKANSNGERETFLGLIEALWRSGSDPLSHHATRALVVGQWDTMTPAAAALAAMGARAGTGDPTLQAAIRERQDIAADWQATDRRLIEQLSQGGQGNTSLEKELRERLTRIEKRLEAIDTDLAAKFPRYHELARPAPLGLEAVQSLLAADEVAIQFVVAPEATYVWAISKDRIGWHRAPIREMEIRSLVRALRCGLDETEWFGEGMARCTTLLGLTPEQIPPQGEPLPFDPVSAHNLFRILLEPVAREIAGKDLLVVASGPLTALPLQVLVAEAPPARGAKPDYASVAWLGHRHAITVLPSLASLASIRQLARSSMAAKPYVGVGNPLLTGANGADRRAFDVPECVIAPGAPQRIAALAAKPGHSAARGAATNIELLRRQEPLPETAEELCRVARFVEASSADVFVGARATEARIKEMSAAGSLADARVLHFATHGLLAGETAQLIAGKAEPALVLTPPAVSSETDDGLLTASEVAGLKLDADWVVLSACNTAAGDQVGAEALSGLARAFFYAGARSILVSHWAVDSDSTVKLITTAFQELAHDPGLTQSRALARAMKAMAASGGRAAHPTYWSPFVVVGGNAPLASTLQLPVVQHSGASTPAVQPAAMLITQPPAKATPARKDQTPLPKSGRSRADEEDWKARALSGGQ